MIIGAHSIVLSSQPDADRAFLRDILQLTHVDVGEGWLIFGLPPSEVAIHPSEGDSGHELYLMVDDVNGFIEEMKQKEIETSEVEDQGWGLLTSLSLPGGGKLGVYEPRHERPEPMNGHGSNGFAVEAAPRKRAAKKRAPKKKKAAAKKSPKPTAAKKKKAAKKRR